MNKLTTRDLTQMALCLAILIVSSYLKVLLPLVPVTMQVMAVIGIGLLLGPKKGGLTILVYIIIGLLGIPVFADGGGFAYIFRPSFGFILGFLLSAIVVGLIIEKLPTSLKSYFVASIIGILVIYIVGIPYLYFISTVYGSSQSSFFQILTTFFMTYFPKDLISGLLMAVIAYRLRPIISKTN